MTTTMITDALCGAKLCTYLKKVAKRKPTYSLPFKKTPRRAKEYVSSIWEYVGNPNIVYALMQGFAKQGIDNAAHVGGLLGGCLLAYILPERFDMEHYKKIVSRHFATGTAISAFLIAGAVHEAPQATVDQSRIFASVEIAKRGFTNFQDSFKEVQQLHGDMQSGKLSEWDGDIKGRTVLAPRFREVVKDLKQVVLHPNDHRKDMLKDVISISELMAEALAMESIQVGNDPKPQPANPERMAQIEAETLASWEAPAALAAILLTGLWGFWTMKTGQMDQWEDKDEVERAKAPSWNHGLDTLQGGMRWEDIRDRLSKEGYKMRCYGLGHNEGMEPGDTHACWTVANQTWGIPTHTLSFLFGPEGLRQVRIDYGKDQWPAVKSWFDQLPGVPTGTFGRDQGGNIIIGKMIASGQVLTAEPKHMPNMMVLWQARSRLQETLCKGTEHDPKWNLICKPSNP